VKNQGASNRRSIDKLDRLGPCTLNRGESGDTYDIDVQTWLGFKAPSLSASMRLLDTAESGEAYDAEVEQSSREELRLVSSLNRAQGVDPSHW
jgi:hypothetical protein